MRFASGKLNRLGYSMSVIREPIHLGSFALPLEFYLTLVGAICNDKRRNSHLVPRAEQMVWGYCCCEKLNAEHGTKLNEDFYRAVKFISSGGMADNHVAVIVA